jgi:hypothetical protein
MRLRFTKPDTLFGGGGDITYTIKEWCEERYTENKMAVFIVVTDLKVLFCVSVSVTVLCVACNLNLF